MKELMQKGFIMTESIGFIKELRRLKRAALKNRTRKAKKQARYDKRHSLFKIDALEDRILLSADPVAGEVQSITSTEAGILAAETTQATIQNGTQTAGDSNVVEHHDNTINLDSSQLNSSGAAVTLKTSGTSNADSSDSSAEASNSDGTSQDSATTDKSANPIASQESTSDSDSQQNSNTSNADDTTTGKSSDASTADKAGDQSSKDSSKETEKKSENQNALVVDTSSADAIDLDPTLTTSNSADNPIQGEKKKADYTLDVKGDSSTADKESTGDDKKDATVPQSEDLMSVLNKAYFAGVDDATAPPSYDELEKSGLGYYSEEKGAFIVDTHYLEEQGLLEDGSTLVINEGFVLGGSGVLNVNLINENVFSPGYSPGKTTLTGGYTQSGTLLIELGGTTAAADTESVSQPDKYDNIEVEGDISLDGTLNVTLYGSTFADTIAVGDTFDIITIGTTDGKITGGFDTIK